MKHRVLLAGYNVEPQALSGNGPLTPEVFSAAYARISRSKKDVPALRQEARGDLVKARERNQRIIFGYGHASVAEHAVFNFDIMGITRLALEYLEALPFASFTEKSQRYVTFGSDFYLPRELPAHLVDRARQAFKAIHGLYLSVIDEILPVLESAYRSNSREWRRQKAKEDARYLLPLCTQSQVGMTINARALEDLVRYLRSQPLAELHILADALAQAAAHVAPSLIRYTEARSVLREKQFPACRAWRTAAAQTLHKAPSISWLRCNRDLDRLLVQYMVFSNSGLSFSEAGERVQRMARSEIAAMFHQVYADLNAHDSLPKEWRHACVEFAALMSASCFAQLKRHRRAAITAQAYDVALGIMVPETIDLGPGTWQQGVRLFERIYSEWAASEPSAASYFLTNGHMRRVVCRFDIQSLYNFFRLRSDKGAQWEIRRLADNLLARLKQRAPFTCALAGGKDAFAKIKKEYLHVTDQS